MGNVHNLELEAQFNEYEEVKRKFDEFKNFKKLTNKPSRLIVKKEDIIKGVEQTEISEKYNEWDIYQWIHS